MSGAAPSLHAQVRDLYETPDTTLNLSLIAGKEGLENEITSPRIQKLGLALAGYVDYVHKGRVQFIGGTEINYLRRLSDQELREAIQRVFSRSLCCILITRGLQPPLILLDAADRNRVPILRTPVLSSVAITQVTGFLEEKLAPRTSIHGVLMDVFNLGVLLFGVSGIGKSECALDLILRGHRLVSDDMVVIRKLGVDRLVGTGPPDFQFHMELRGLGILNLKELFGVSVLSRAKTIDLAIHMVRWKSDEEYDRLGVDESYQHFLDVPVPLVTMPVAPGRHLATLVEVAVRIQLLKNQGYSPSREFVRQLDQLLQKP
ncbi:MAG: HPr(Ser) kinase/phosphatase [Acidobacteria bacterium]|nr:HPr(Ser) kinase/phosphatase [Acidobacteriota bacterium]